MKREEKIDLLKILKDNVKVELRMGLCGRIYFLNMEKRINKRQAHYLYKLVEKELKVTKYRENPEFCWKPGLIRPRIKWINQQIKLLEKK